MKRDAPDEETDGSVLEAANAAAKRVASKWDIGGGGEEVAAAPPAGVPSLMDLMASNPAPGDAAATIDAVLGAHPSCADGPEPLIDWETTQVQLKMHLHGDVVAALLSHEGATLVSIRTNSGCRVKIMPADPSDPMHRKLHMGGAQEAVCAALGYVLAEMQKSCANNPAVCDSTGYKVRMLVRSDSCGSIIGKGGSVIAQIRQQSGAVVKMDQANGPEPVPQPGMLPNDRGITFNGQLPNVHVALLEVVPKLALYIKQYRDKAAVAAPGQAIMSSGHDPSMNADGSHPLEQGPGHVHVMNSIMVGRVIGPGGTQIREIRDKTGARVRVSNDKLPGTQDRAVTIWGSDDQVQQVLAMINGIVSQPDSRPPRQGGGAPPQQQQQYGYAPPQQYQAYGQPPPGGYYAPPQQYGQQPVQYAPQPVQYYDPNAQYQQQYAPQPLQYAPPATPGAPGQMPQMPQFQPLAPPQQPGQLAPPPQYQQQQLAPPPQMAPPAGGLPSYVPPPPDAGGAFNAYPSYAPPPPPSA